MIRAIIMLETLSPTELTIVAGGSTKVPIMVMSGMASIGWADQADPKNKNCGAFCEFKFGVFGIYPGGRFNWTIGLIRADKNGKVVANVCKAPDPYFFEH